MTPERREEIDKQIEWWRKSENWRKHGFNIKCSDPLFAPRATPPPEETIPEIVYCRPWMYDWWEHEKDFDFTQRVKYTHKRGDFERMYLEIKYENEQRLWQNMWQPTYITVTRWVDADNFEFRPKYQDEYEEVIVDCN